MCEVTYGVIVRCQWTFTCTTPTWKHSMEHSGPLMVNDIRACFFKYRFFFLTISLSFQSVALMVDTREVVNFSWPDDLVRRRGCGGQSTWLLMAFFSGWKKNDDWKLLEVGTRQRREENFAALRLQILIADTNVTRQFFLIVSVIWLSFYCVLVISQICFWKMMQPLLVVKEMLTEADVWARCWKI